MNRSILETRRRLEARIEDLIALLDLVGDDCDLEDDDREPDETDMNGDEGDYSPADNGDDSVGRLNGGCGL